MDSGNVFNLLSVRKQHHIRYKTMKTNTISSLLLVVAGSACCTSCNLGTAGNAIASAYVNQLVTGQSTSAGAVAGQALQTLLKDNPKYGDLGLIATELFKSFTNKGTAFNYSGTANVEALSGTYEPMAYNSIGKAAPVIDATLTTNAATVAASNTAALTLSAYSVGNNVKVSELTIANLGLSHSGSTTSIALTDNSGFGNGCTCTVDGKTYNAATVYITSATVSDSQLSLNVTVYYGENYTNPVNITYTGKLK